MKYSPLLLLLVTALPAVAQKTSPVLMLSDIHLDPFHDPGKLSQLRAAPITGWSAVLDAPPTPTQAADFAQLQSTCAARGVDTPIALLESALHAAQHQQPQPLFVTVSGDLMAHQFDCRFHSLAPTATPADYSAFAAKTIAFIALQLRLAFPGTPIYLALGNNDSGCEDYREDPSSAFLHADATAFAANMTTSANRAAIERDFSQFGDYNAALPIPNTRLVVLQDIFESRRYTACDGKRARENVMATQIQITWLRTQLQRARADHEYVWVMAHIPPGVDTYSTLSHGLTVCSSVTTENSAGPSEPSKPMTFLSTDDLADTLAAFPDVIRLALFGHTHMDEFRVYAPAAGAPASANPIPGKLVPSLTPVNGNTPAFTLAELDPATATLKDYAVYIANNQTGLGTTWSEEYRYSTTYQQPDLSGTSVAKITGAFLADKSGTAAISRAYARYFYATAPASSTSPMASLNIAATLRAAAMQTLWPAYACALTNTHAADFQTCACPTPTTHR